MQAILQRFRTMLFTEKADMQTAQEFYDRLMPAELPGTFYWKDLDYSAQPLAFWPTAQHYTRLQIILAAFGQDKLQDKIYVQRLTGALAFWLNHNFESPNWWYNQIGIPQAIGNIALMLHPVLEESILKQAATLVAKGSMAENAAIAADWKGTNVIWGAMNTIRHGLLTNNTSLFPLASQRAARELTAGAATGIQKDGSFFQHGPRLYSGGYGKSFAEDISKLLFLLQNTPYQLPQDKIHIFLTFLLDGLRYMFQGSSLDFACVGREFSRPDALSTQRLKGVIDLLLATDGIPRKEELKKFFIHPDETKYFPEAAFLSHRFHGIYVGAKFMNDRLLGTETCDGEGILSYNLSYGTHTCIMRTGAEYYNIDPVWDFARIPGTTARAETDLQLLMKENWLSRRLPNSHSGGGQNGRRAIVYEYADHDHITLLAADFAFEDGFICLGADIASEDNIATTVDQCHLTDDITMENGSVLHNSIRYTSLNGIPLEVSCKPQQGSWKRNNLTLSENPMTMQVLTVTAPHRKNTYAYMISAADKPLPQVKVLQNDSAIQAIELPDGKIMAVFHQNAVLGNITGKAGELIL